MNDRRDCACTEHGECHETGWHDLGWLCEWCAVNCHTQQWRLTVGKSRPIRTPEDTP